MKQDWEVRKLGDVCELINRGVSPKYTETNGLIVLNQKCIRNHEVNYDLARVHDNKVKPVNSEKLIKIGDVLINSTGTGTLGRVAQIRDEPNEATVDSHITIVRPLPNFFYNEFFGYALILIEEKIAERGEGCGGQTELARNTLKNEFYISFPKSIQEQQAIVSILDEAFAAIAQAKANAEQNLQNAKELFESYLQSVFENKGDDWEEKALGEVCEELFAGGDVPKENSSKIKTNKFYIPIFSNGEKNKGLYGYTNVARVIKPSITISARGTIGYSVIREEPFYPAIRLIVLIPKIDIINLSFLKFAISSIDITHSGSSIPQLTVPMIKGYPIPYPPLKEQQVIVEKLDALSTETKQLEAIYQQKINDLAELKKSILQKAFAGELNTSALELEV
ncbi:MAG: restriction endonuclease subunit S [Methylococcales bacterium]|nr:restriction endonuclease subunit S [Methylococcales bacterium]